MGAERAVIYLTRPHSPIINTHSRTHANRRARGSKWRSEWADAQLKKWCKFPALQPRSLSFSCSLSTRGWFIGEVKGDEKLTLLALAQCGLFRCVASCAGATNALSLETNWYICLAAPRAQRAAQKLGWLTGISLSQCMCAGERVQCFNQHTFQTSSGGTWNEIVLLT